MKSVISFLMILFFSLGTTLQSMESDQLKYDSAPLVQRQLSTDIKEFEQSLALSDKEWQEQAEKFDAIRQGKKVKEVKFWSDENIFPPLANRLGRMKLEEKKDEEGVKLFERSAQQYPPSAFALGAFYMQQGDQEKGLPLMRLAAQSWSMEKEKDFLYLPAVRALAAFLLKKNNPQFLPEALEVAQRGAIADDARSCLIAALTMYKMGNYDPIEYLKKAVVIARAQKKDALKEEALDLINPDLSDVKTNDWLINQYLEDKDYESAVAIFKTVVDESLSKEPYLADVMECKALKQFRKLATDRTVKKTVQSEMQEVLATLDRASIAYHYTQARNALYQEDWTNAIDHCFQVEELLPRFHEDEDFSQVETSGIFELLQNLKGKNNYLDLLHGTLLIHRATKYNQRLSCFNSCIDQVRAGASIVQNLPSETDPVSVGNILCHAAQYFKKQNATQEAVACLENAKKRKSSHACWLLALSILDNKKENADKVPGALRDLYAILEYDPSVAFLLVTELKELGKSFDNMGFSEKKIISALRKAFDQGSVWAANSLHGFGEMPREDELKKDTTQPGYLKRAIFYYAKKKFDQASAELSQVDFETCRQAYFLQALIDLQNNQEASRRRAMDGFLTFLKRNSDYLIVSQVNNKAVINPFLPHDTICPTDLHISINAALARIFSAAMQGDCYALTVGSDLFLTMYRRNGNVHTFKLFQEYFGKLCAFFYGPRDSIFVAPLLERILESQNSEDVAVVWYAVKLLQGYPEMRSLVKKDTLTKAKKILESTKEKKSLYFSETEKREILQAFRVLDHAAWSEEVCSDFRRALGKSTKLSNGFMPSPVVIAEMYLQGKTNLKPNVAGTRAIEILTTQVKLREDSSALEKLIELYDQGWGDFVKKDPTKSRQLVEDLAAQGNMAALIKLARWYRYAGHPEIKLDRQKALELMLKIFERDKDSASELGILYAEMADYENAAQYLSPFKHTVSPYGLCCLAAMHLDGVGCEQSFEKFLICVEELVKAADVWDSDSRIANALVTIFANIKKSLDRDDCCSARINYLLGALILGASRMNGRNIICCKSLLTDDWQRYLNTAIKSENLVIQAKCYLLWTWAEGQELKEKKGNEKAQRFQKAVMYLIKVARALEQIEVDAQDILNPFVSEYNYLQDVYRSLDKNTEQSNKRVLELLEKTIQQSKFFKEFEALQLVRNLQRFGTLKKDLLK